MSTNVAPPTTYSAAATGSVSGIGGTSGGGANSSGNVLSMNVGGVSVNYDLGPNTESFADQAYDYLDNSMTADTALLGSTVAGSEDFLSGLAEPVLSMAQSQQQFNTQTLPTMFGTLQAQNQSLGSQAIQSESGLATASMADSAAESEAASESASSGGGGLCWLTSLICEELGEPDDGPTLTTLRAFRDTYMDETPERKALVSEYYTLLPVLRPYLASDPKRRIFLHQLYSSYIPPILYAIKHHLPDEALRLYQSMVHAVKERYLPEFHPRGHEGAP